LLRCIDWIWLVLVVIKLVEATPRINNRTAALCAPIAARPNIEATTTGIVVGHPKGLHAANVAAKPTRSSVSSASTAARTRRATARPTMQRALRRRRRGEEQ
jgi:hypothetical protein